MDKGDNFWVECVKKALTDSARPVLIISSDHKVLFANKTFLETYGFSKDEVLGKTCDFLGCKEPKEDFRKAMEAGKPWQGTIRCTSKQGMTYLVQHTIVPFCDSDGSLLLLMVLQEGKPFPAHLLTDLKAKKTSPILFERDAFMAVASTMLENAGDEGRFALLLLDLDRLGRVSAAFGVGVVDGILRRTPQLLLERLERLGLLGRALIGKLGGDEYAVLLSDATARESAAIAKDLCRTFGTDLHPGLPAWCTCSIGISLFPLHGRTLRDLLQAADASLAVAKELGGNTFQVYEERYAQESRSRLALKDEVAMALQEGRVLPFFQPILDLKTGNVRHFEALARLVARDGATKSASEFMEVAERFGLVSQVDLAILERTVEVLKSLAKQQKDVSISVNISAKDFFDPDFLKNLEKVVSQLENPSNLILEITETMGIKDLKMVSDSLSSVTRNGVMLALDDFGSGFSSLRYLKELPVKFLKIDGSFVKGLEKDQKNQEVVRMIGALGNRLKIRTIAEFVDSIETIRLLRRFKVDMAQGYLIGKPMPAPSFDAEKVQWFRKRG
jgi:diguanylate cyclase (GGDEF)-like protein/PAS domain S-box-containing protein